RPRGACGRRAHAAFARVGTRHGRPTRTAGILPALISRYTVRRLTWRYSRTSSVVRNVSSIIDWCPPVAFLTGLHRQFDGKHGAASWVVGGDNLSAVVLDDPVRDRQA